MYLVYFFREMQRGLDCFTKALQGCDAPEVDAIEDSIKTSADSIASICPDLIYKNQPLKPTGGSNSGADNSGDYWHSLCPFSYLPTYIFTSHLHQ